MSDASIAKRYLILQGEVGSRAHGLNTEQSDHDLMGVCVEPPTHVIGLEKFANQGTFVVRSKPEGVPSGPDDTDYQCHSLRKFIALALKGNPSILSLFFVPEPTFADKFGEELQRVRSLFASRKAALAFAGYMEDQRLRLQGKKAKHGRIRHELIQQFGYDTKYAGHLIRLGYQGVDFLTSGGITLPMPGYQARVCRAIRQGLWSETGVYDLAKELEQQIRKLEHTSPLPDEPNYRLINDWLITFHVEYWKAKYYA